MENQIFPTYLCRKNLAMHAPLLKHASLFCFHLLPNWSFPVPEEADAYEELFATYSDRTHIPSYIPKDIRLLFASRILLQTTQIQSKASCVILRYQSLIPRRRQRLTVRQITLTVHPLALSTFTSSSPSEKRHFLLRNLCCFRLIRADTLYKAMIRHGRAC